MKRKIPGKKHRGVKDPEKQRQERLNSLKDKINAPPTNPDDQAIPKSLQRFMELKEKMKKGDFKRKTKKPKKPPIFAQGPNESTHKFLQRINEACEMAKHEVAFENKFRVKIQRNKVTGEVEKVVKQPKDKTDVILKEIEQTKKENKEKKMTKSQKRRMKLMEKKKIREENMETKQFKRFDDIKFGETVHAPPTLPTPRKVDRNKTKPGERALLLKDYLQKNGQENGPNNQKTIIDKKGKRKDLPIGIRRQLDQQQSEIIEVYRNLKATKKKTK